MYVSLSSLPTVVINLSTMYVLDTCTLDMCTLLHIIEPSHMVRTRVGVTVLVTGLGLSMEGCMQGNVNP